MTNLLFLAKSENIPESSRRLLDVADRELQRVGHITRQTLGFYRETASPSEIDLRDILKGVVGIVFEERSWSGSRSVTASKIGNHESASIVARIPERIASSLFQPS